MKEIDNDITGKIIGWAIIVHNVLGPGLLESAYISSILWTGKKRANCWKGLTITVGVGICGKKLECGYRIDFFVEKSIIVEIKSVDVIDQLM